MSSGIVMGFALSFESGLYLSAALLGVAGGLHCAGMCGPVGAALCGGAQKPAFRWWNVTRLASYGSAGALAGGGSQWLLSAGAHWPALRAAWVMLQFAALAVALLMIFAPRTAGWRGLAGQTGWMPVTLGAVAQSVRTLPTVGATGLAEQRVRALSMHGGDSLDPGRAIHVGRGAFSQSGATASGSSVHQSRRSGLAGRWGAFTGLLWAGFPCGLLHGALLMAWLLAGAGLMQRLRASGRWSELRIRRVTGGLLLASWLLLAMGMVQGGGSDCAVQHSRWST